MNKEWLEKAKKLANEYAHVYSFVGDNTMPVARKELFEHLKLAVDTVERKIPVNIPEGYDISDVFQHNAIGHNCIMLQVDIRPIAQSVGESIHEQIAQAKADKAAYPEVWWKAWVYRTKNTNAQWIIPIHGSNFSVSNDGCEYRRHPLADIIMRCGQDKIDYPEFWNELTQWANLNSENWRVLPFDTDQLFDFNRYREHPHRKSIIAYYACSDEDKKRWQFREIDANWHDCRGNPEWNDGYEYRLRPRMCSVTIGDKVYEYPEPVRKPLEIGQHYWRVSTMDGITYNEIWEEKSMQVSWLNLGFIHLTKESAEQHFATIQAMNTLVAL